jgi:hypothetical protein
MGVEAPLACRTIIDTYPRRKRGGPMAGIPCIEQVERALGSVVGHPPATGTGGSGVIMPTSPAAHL